jgi:hypothetical protein
MEDTTDGVAGARMATTARSMSLAPVEFRSAVTLARIERTYYPRASILIVWDGRRVCGQGRINWEDRSVQRNQREWTHRPARGSWRRMII